MVTIEVPVEGEPMIVQLDGKEGIKFVPSAGSLSPAHMPLSAQRHSHSKYPSSTSLAVEAKYPKASFAIDSFSIIAATFLSTLALLPVARAKILRQLPRSPAAWPSTHAHQSFSPFRLIVSQLAGAKPAMQETTIRFASTSVFPPPLSLLVGYLGAIPLNAAVVRAQAGFRIAHPSSMQHPSSNVPAASAPITQRHTARLFNRRLPRLTSIPGYRLAWFTHVLRDIPFTIAEACAIAFLLNAVAGNNKKNVNGHSTSTANANTNRATALARPDMPRPRPFDAAFGSAFAGFCTAPLDLLRTRLMVSAKPSIRRTVVAAARLLHQRGLRHFSVPNGTTFYIAECMIRPVAFLSIFSVCRGALITSMVTFQRRREQIAANKAMKRRNRDMSKLIK